MKRLFLYIPFISAALSLTSCSDETASGLPDSEKTPVSLTVGHTDISSLTRAVVSGGTPAKAFTEDTRLFFYMEAQNGDATKKKWGCNYGTAAGVDDAADGSKSAVAFNGNSLYWDDAFARDTRLTIYSLAMANSMAESMETTSPAVTLNSTTSRYAFTEAATDIAPTVSITLGNGDKQDVTSVAQQDLVFSNNVSTLSGEDKRLKFDNTAKLFDKGDLVYNHALTSMTFKLKAGDGFTGVDDFNFVDATGNATGFELKGFYGKGTFNVKDGTFSSQDVVNHTDIAHTATPTAESKAHTLKALLVPGTDITAATEAVSFIIAGNKYVLTMAQLYNAIKGNADNMEGGNVKDTVLDGGKQLKAGVNYEFVFTVSKSKIENITAAVVDWENVGTEEQTPSNARIVITTKNDKGTAITDASVFNLYRAVDPGNTAVTDDYIGFNYLTGYEGPATLTYTDGKFTTNWYWESNAAYYHFRATNTDASQAETGDYISLASKEGTYGDVLWGAPFKSAVDKFSYDTANGFDRSASTVTDIANHDIHHAIGATKSAVSLTLFHLMSDITFKVRTTTSDNKVTLADGEEKTTIKLKSVAKTGKALMGNGRVTADNESKADFSFANPSITYKDGAEPKPVDYISWHGGFVPQSLDGVQLVITTPDKNEYVVDLKDVLTSTPPTYSNVSYPAYEGNKVSWWHPGIRYTYTFTLTKTGIENITANIVGWEEVTAGDDNVQIQ